MMTEFNSSTKPNLLIYGETLIDEFPSENVIGGAPFNVARSLALLGACPCMVSRIGSDQNGERILEEMQRTKLSRLGMQIDPDHASGRVVVHMPNAEDASSHRFEILRDQAYDFIESQAVQSILAEYFSEVPPDLIYFGSLIQRSAVSRETLFGLLEAELAEGATKFLDLNLRDGQASLETITVSLNYADIVKLNEDELQFVLHHCCDSPEWQVSYNEASLRGACQKLMDIYYMQAIIVTLGAKGYFYLDSTGVCFHSLDMDTPRLNIVDTVGAGDAFAAVFILGWQMNWPLPQSLEAARQFASAICGVRGAVAESTQFYQDWRKQWEARFAG
ncbi:PfkB family carbohydrate kinase [Undibacterium fentianense]|uniref:Fructokinase n=1 Tax=Undibacterium fentianense TaxID=2828728 RepID=A0A941E9J4_9BURK|nr:PfkB family carbohydrate kinase [Undibacterium fentianense]MBR7801098.1 fructokinase [Undibacterium fentianense]